MSIGNIIGLIFCIPLIGMLYVAIGGFFHPNSEKRWINMLFIMFWPIVLIIGFFTLPINLVWKISKTKEETEKELTKFCHENK